MSELRTTFIFKNFINTLHCGVLAILLTTRQRILDLGTHMRYGKSHVVTNDNLRNWGEVLE